MHINAEQVLALVQRRAIGGAAAAPGGAGCISQCSRRCHLRGAAALGRQLQQQEAQRTAAQ